MELKQKDTNLEKGGTKNPSFKYREELSEPLKKGFSNKIERNPLVKILDFTNPIDELKWRDDEW